MIKIVFAVCDIILLCCIFAAIKISRKNRIKIEEQKRNRKAKNKEDLITQIN